MLYVPFQYKFLVDNDVKNLSKLSFFFNFRFLMLFYSKVYKVRILNEIHEVLSEVFFQTYCLDSAFIIFL